MILAKLDHDEIRQSILEIKLGLKNPAVFKQLKEKYTTLFESYIKSDKDNIIRALKIFKRKGFIEYGYLRNPDNEEAHGEFSEYQSEEIENIYTIIQEQGILSETIPALTLLNNSKTLRLDVLLPDLVSNCFAVYEEIYNKSKVDVSLIREHAERIVHFAVQETLSMLDDPGFNKLMAEGRRISIEQTEANRAIIDYLRDEDGKIDIAAYDKSKMGAQYDRLNIAIEKMGFWQIKRNEFIFSTGYKELLKKHFETLGIDIGDDRVYSDEIYPDMSALDTFLDPSASYYKLRQGPTTNTFIKTDLRTKRFDVNHINKGVVKSKNMNFIIYDFKNGVSQVSGLAKELFTFIVLFITNKGGDVKNHRQLLIPVDQYLGIKGRVISKDNKKNAQKEIRKLLSELNSLRIDVFDDSDGAKSGEVNLFSSWDVKRGYIDIEFPTKFLQILSNSHIMPMPRDLFKVDSRTNAFPLGMKLLTHVHQNFFKSNKGIIGVKTLLESCPEIPSLEELGDARQVSKRIITPFERALEELETSIRLTWNYCGKNGSIIKEPQTYNEFISSQILFEIGDYPQREKKALPNKKYRRKSKSEGTKNEN